MENNLKKVAQKGFNEKKQLVKKLLDNRRELAKKKASCPNALQVGCQENAM